MGQLLGSATRSSSVRAQAAVTIILSLQEVQQLDKITSTLLQIGSVLLVWYITVNCEEPLPN